jgi:hypothetical protein
MPAYASLKATYSSSLRPHTLYQFFFFLQANELAIDLVHASLCEPFRLKNRVDVVFFFFFFVFFFPLTCQPKRAIPPEEQSACGVLYVIRPHTSVS